MELPAHVGPRRVSALDGSMPGVDAEIFNVSRERQCVRGGRREEEGE